MHRLKTLGALLLGAGIAAPTLAVAQDGGAEIAARWCANCHATGIAEQRRAKDVAPTFDDIASRLDSGQVKAALIAPHRPMLGIDLSSRDIDAMVTFITDRP